MRLIKMRYKAIQSRVDALFPCGTSRSTNPNKLKFGCLFAFVKIKPLGAIFNIV